MTIGIIGSNGFLGTAVAKWANNRSLKLNVYGRTNPVGYSCDRFVKCDLMESIPSCEDLSKADIVVYAAGAGVQANFMEQSSIVYNLNTAVPVAICNGLRESGFMGHFVSFGSVFEMGRTKLRRLFTEEDVVSSTAETDSDYVVSKRMFTRFAGGYPHEFTHLHFILPTIYGPGENPSRLVPYTIDAIRAGIPLHFTDGGQTRQYLSVEEVPVAVELAYDKGIPSGVYNLQGAETLTVKEIVTQIYQSFGVQAPEGSFGILQREDIRMRYLALDGRKLHNAAGFQARMRLIEMIDKYKVYMGC